MAVCRGRRRATSSATPSATRWPTPPRRVAAPAGRHGPQQWLRSRLAREHRQCGEESHVRSRATASRQTQQCADVPPLARAVTLASSGLPAKAAAGVGWQDHSLAGGHHLPSERCGAPASRVSARTSAKSHGTHGARPGIGAVWSPLPSGERSSRVDAPSCRAGSESCESREGVRSGSNSHGVLPMASWPR
jgi:hypothetical protein